MSLPVRFPRLRGQFSSAPIVPAETGARYPKLAADLRVLDHEVAPAFAAYDGAALRYQSTYRRQQLFIILGAFLLTVLYGLQAVFQAQSWIGLVVLPVLFLLTIGLPAWTTASPTYYLDARLKAERLRALFFRFLSRTAPYVGAERELALRDAVFDISEGNEPGWLHRTAGPSRPGSRSNARDAQFGDLYREVRIDDEYAFYRVRSAEYERAHRRTIAVRTALLILALAAGGVAGQVFKGLAITNTGRAGLSVIAASLAALVIVVTAFEELTGFPQLRKLYKDVEANLQEAQADWDVSADDLAVKIDRVEQIFRGQSGQWGQLAIGASSNPEWSVLQKPTWSASRSLPWSARNLAWSTNTYRVADRPAVRFETVSGHYIKFERYDDGVSANWSTADGPEVLLSIPLLGKTSAAQFWTSDSESEECPLPELAPDLLERRSNVIRAWVETDRELIVWRLADTGSAGVAQLGVLMRSWNPERVEELVSASATRPVKNAINERLEDARTWVIGRRRRSLTKDRDDDRW